MLLLAFRRQDHGDGVAALAAAPRGGRVDEPARGSGPAPFRDDVEVADFGVVSPFDGRRQRCRDDADGGAVRYRERAPRPVVGEQAAEVLDDLSRGGGEPFFGKEADQEGAGRFDVCGGDGRDRDAVILFHGGIVPDGVGGVYGGEEKSAVEPWWRGEVRGGG